MDLRKVHSRHLAWGGIPSKDLIMKEIYSGLILHSMRHPGLMFLTRGAASAGMPPEFAYPAAIKDSGINSPSRPSYNYGRPL